MDEAIILHLRPYRESSYLVDLFARQAGRQRLVARGARRRTRWTGPGLASFARIFFVAGGRGELRCLSNWEKAPESPELAGGSIFCGFYMAELLLKLLPQSDPSPRLYDETLLALRDLSGGVDPELRLRRFEKVLLDEAGYGLRLFEDVEGRPIEAELQYTYHPEHGPEIVQGTGDAFSGSVLIGLRTGQFQNDRDRVLAKRLMRKVLDLHLEGRAIRSRELFKAFLGRG